MKRILGIALIIVVLIGGGMLMNTKSHVKSHPEISQELKTELEGYIKNNYLTPDNYVVSKFKDHDIVFLGEYHRIKHDVEFIQKLIPKLYENGVYTMGIEFANYDDQERIDELITAEHYDEILAKDIQFQQWALWGYQEYIDLYKAAWEYNSKLADHQRKFRIIGLNKKIHFDKEDWQREITRVDQHMADVVINQIVNKGDKALIYAGINHAYTKYKQPIIPKVQNKNSRVELFNGRMGNIVYGEIGDRAFTIFLHAPWEDKEQNLVYPVDGVIDTVMYSMDEQFKSVGFDTKGTPFGELKAKSSLWSSGYEDFKLATYCDGYIYTKPISEYEGVSLAKDYITKENYKQIASQMANKETQKYAINQHVLKMILKKDTNIKKRFNGFK